MAISHICTTEDHDDNVQKNHLKQEGILHIDLHERGMITGLQRHPEGMNKSSRGRANSVHGMNNATVLEADQK